MNLRQVFFGTPHFAEIVLDELKNAGYAPSLIVTMPDRPAGRGNTITPPPVKLWAERNGITVLQPETVRDDILEPLSNSEWDIFIVASWGMIIPNDVLSIPRHGCLNVHPSLLPKYRGASPIRSQILEDDRECGVSIMLLDEKMDHGPILAQARIEIENEDWPPEATVLEDLLAHEGGILLAQTIPEWIKGNITPEDQDHTRATYTKKIEKADSLIDLTDNPWENFLKIRAFQGNPGTHFFAVRKNGEKVRVKIIDAEYTDGKLILTRVIPEGKKEMAYMSFIQGL